MPKTYSAKDGAGNRTYITAPVSSGTTLMLVYKGPTLGNQYDYSTAVDGTSTFYVVDNGPTLGRERSAT